MALENIRIVLVNTSHSGNIGSAARAMKTMGFSNLYLVDPACEIDSHASALAAGATDVLGQAQVVDTLEQALEGCVLAIGTSARSRTLSWPMVDPRQCGEKLVKEGGSSPVALVFGRENSGLTNEELQLCNFHVCIPANPDYSSLNLAMAVQTLCYETRMQFLDTQEQAVEQDDNEYPTNEQMQRFYEHLQSTFSNTGFIIKQHPGQVMTKLKRLFNRARPEQQELNILRGMLTSVDKQQNNQD
ncbi:tRNA (cytosine(32)/uridine(32)-2'-O)-methyltransferase TrmJ [Pseudoalteromonas ruthenica]|uniref:tRNA (cytosine(32)/uridine(32)-2'-O)-methyltransferase TrmJ n=1 Tax=Pseudoalteromonas ruthenica TaxID=151081 RepID=UPI00110B0AE4|nr:tRNA (cytosine(32)/uridine(32)-2'-O)-methyltransferase TrmJ [Pseudoalteromonas ruthenica]TMO47967.1 tRNA (cytosine(32)/uridine(32)-2'-O)-methyltransferase TrmJ [Pseudoalteromonas ruthenica]TMO49700.1 tRNA (cytosine(32)/uridine(32)-2'-O)-methyltransferase TrmJ [Pseudoalteromonas ruthenica]